MQAAPPPAFEAMKSTGQSEKWKKYKSNVMRILVLMLQVINGLSSTHPLKGVYQASFDEFTADHACTEQIYGLYATFLAEQYDTTGGRAEQPTFLSPGRGRRLPAGAHPHRQSQVRPNRRPRPVLLHVRRRPVHVCDGAVAQGRHQQHASHHVSAGMTFGPATGGADVPVGRLALVA